MQKIKLTFGLILVGVLVLIVSYFYPFSKPNLKVEIQNTPFLMPAALNVYSNPNALNGKYYLFKAKLTNVSKVKMKDIRIRYRIIGFVDWTDLDPVSFMNAGQTAVVTCYPRLNETVATKLSETVEKTEIEITWDGVQKEQIIKECFTFKFVDRNTFYYTNIPADEVLGWQDIFSNTDLLPCFVTSTDPIVSYYTQVFQEKLLKGETTVSGDARESIRFLKGIYQATLLSGMVYSGTKGLPDTLEDVSSLVQHLRLPREVITGNTGLCIELSLLYASILSRAGLHPVIFFMPKHAFPGIKLDGQYFAIEATGVGGEGIGGSISADSAFYIGMIKKNYCLNAISRGEKYFDLIDIDDLNKNGSVPLTLSDDEFLRKKVDEIAKSFRGTIPQMKLWQIEGQSKALQENKEQNNAQTDLQGKQANKSFYDIDTVNGQKETVQSENSDKKNENNDPITILEPISISQAIDTNDENYNDCTPSSTILKYLKQQATNNVQFKTINHIDKEYYAISLTEADLGNLIGKTSIEVILKKINDSKQIIVEKAFSRSSIKPFSSCIKSNSCAEELASDILEWLNENSTN